MRKSTLFTGIIIFVVVFTASLLAKGLDLPNPVYGTPPPPSVKRWTRLAVIGEIDAPYPIIWIAPQAFRRSGFERLIVLKPEEYAAFLDYVDSYRCSGITGRYPERGTLQITEFSSNHQVDVCTTPRAEACNFLAGLSSLGKIGWTYERLKPIRDLATTLECYKN